MTNLLINIWVCPKCGAYIHINDLARYGHKCGYLKPVACTYKKDVPNCNDIDCHDCPHVMKESDQSE